MRFFIQCTAVAILLADLALAWLIHADQMRYKQRYADWYHAANDIPSADRDRYEAELASRLRQAEAEWIDRGNRRLTNKDAVDVAIENAIFRTLGDVKAFTESDVRSHYVSHEPEPLKPSWPLTAIQSLGLSGLGAATWLIVFIMPSVMLKGAATWTLAAARIRAVSMTAWIAVWGAIIAILLLIIAIGVWRIGRHA